MPRFPNADVTLTVVVKSDDGPISGINVLCDGIEWQQETDKFGSVTNKIHSGYYRITVPYGGFPHDRYVLINDDDVKIEVTVE